jgi:hypothetical protein
VRIVGCAFRASEAGLARSECVLKMSRGGECSCSVLDEGRRWGMWPGR